MDKKTVTTAAAPNAVGPYSQGVVAKGLVWVSGQIPLDPASGVLVEGAIAEQTRQVLRNVSAVLSAAGSGIDRVVKATVYLTDLGDFEAMNVVYADFFGANPPARACVEVSRLPRGARVEIEAVALAD